MHLLYVANAMVPGHRAHSIQIVRSCDAFARAGADLELWIPRRRGTGRASPAPEQLKRFYGVRPTFRIRRLPSFDWIDLLPPAAQRPAFLLQSATFAAAVSRRLGSGIWDRLYLRDPHTLYLLGRLRPELAPRTVYEAHTLPRRDRRRRRLGRVLRRVGWVIALNRHLAEAYAALGVSAERLAVVPAAAAGAAVPGDRAAARRDLGLDAEAPVVGYAGSLTPAKGTGVLIAAVRRLPERWRLLLVGGDRRQRAWAGDLAAADPRVCFAGQVAPRQVARYLAAADVLAVPNSARDPSSARWASPMKLFEYHQAGRPIVLTEVPALRMAAEELPAEGGLTWVAADDPGALASGILEAWEARDRPSQFRSAGGWRRRAEQILEHLQREGACSERPAAEPA